MQTNKRKFERFDLPLIVKFRPIYGATDYSLGLTKNFSFEGLSLEANNFNFIQNENLELNLKFPQSGSVVSLFGDVVWKKRAGDKSFAGVKLRVDDKEQQDEIMKKISVYADIPVESIYGKERVDTAVEEKKEEPVLTQAEKIQKQLSEEGKVAGQDEAAAPVSAAERGFVKQYRKGGSKCKVTFRLPGEAAPEAKEVTIVGDFNDWDVSKTPMTRTEDGNFTATIDLKAKREYRFKYLIDGITWENDWQADKYLPNDYGSDDSVLIV